jgi:hypothetical protein
MSYESTDERVEQLERQVTGLISVVKSMNNFMGTICRDAFNSNLSTHDLIIKRHELALKSLKIVVDGSRCIEDENRKIMLNVIATGLGAMSLEAGLLNEIKKPELPVLPIDLFGSPDPPAPHGS